MIFQPYFGSGGLCVRSGHSTTAPGPIAERFATLLLPNEAAGGERRRNGTAVTQFSLRGCASGEPLRCGCWSICAGQQALTHKKVPNEQKVPHLSACGSAGLHLFLASVK